MNIVMEPIQFKKDFLKNPDIYIRDFCCVAGDSVSPFIIFKDKIDKCFENSGANPFNEKLLLFEEGWRPNDIKKVRYMHLDLAHNKCALGISSCYVSHFVDIDISEGKDSIFSRLPFIKFDFIGRIKANVNEEILLPDIESLIYELSMKGIVFNLITFDRFQSVYMIQNLRSKGYISAQMSVERATKRIIRTLSSKDSLGYNEISTRMQYLAAMNAFKEVLYQERMSIPYHAVLKKEIEKSQVDYVKNKVVHLPGGSIDIFHSVAGSTFNAINNTNFFEDVSEEVSRQVADDFYSKHRRTNKFGLENPVEDKVVSIVDDFYKSEYDFY